MGRTLNTAPTGWLPAGVLSLALAAFSGSAGAGFQLEDNGQVFGNPYNRDVAMADLDGDGDLDLFMANNGFNKVWINQGGTQGGNVGDYQPTGQELGDARSYDVALADLDGDGDLDAFVANRYDEPNTVWINDGSGGFTDAGQDLGSFDTRAVALADVDADGDPDAVTVTDYDGNRVWLNDGSGGFTDSGQSLGDSDYLDVALGDVDGDGDIDAIPANNNYNGSNPVWLNDGSGTFTKSGQTLAASRSRAIALADLDGDGDLDAFVGGYTDNTVWLNQGGAQGGTEGDFVDSGQSLDYYPDVTDIALADLENDGDLDVFVSASSDHDVLWLNDGSGNFSAGQSINYYGRGSGAAFGDFDDDGDPDPFVAQDGVPNNIYVNQGGRQGGTLGDLAYPGRLLGVFPAQSAALADFDGDGDKDALLATGSYAGNGLLINDGSGNLNPSGQILPGGYSRDVAVGDLDGDGDTDAFFAGHNYDATVVARNDGSGTFFSNYSDEYSEGDTEGIALADLDGDGDLDAFLANTNGEGNSVLINQGESQGGVQGEFRNSGQLLGSADSRGVALADIDGDRDMDAVVANDNYQPNTVWINMGGDQGATPGMFADYGGTVGIGKSTAIALGDLDGDGDPDAFVTNRDGFPNTVWINQGGDQAGTPGEFADSGQILGGSDSRDVTLLDIDGDEDLDAAVANGNGTTNTVWINDGEGVFTTAGLGLSGSGREFALADLDGDADIDAFVPNGATFQTLISSNPGLFRFGEAEYVADEDGGSVTFAVHRSGGAEGPASVDYATSGGTATADSDYTPVSGTLNWADGEHGEKTVTVDLIDDGDYEGDETVTLVLSNPVGDGASPEPEVGAPGEATLTIADDEPIVVDSGDDGGGNGGGGGGCTLDPAGGSHPGLLALLALLGSAGLLRRRRLNA